MNYQTTTPIGTRSSANLALHSLVHNRVFSARPVILYRAACDSGNYPATIGRSYSVATDCISQGEWESRSSNTETETLRILKEKYSRRAPPKGLDEHTAQYLQKQEEEELRSEFNEVYARFQKDADEMLSSSEFIGFQTIRDKLIAHNELRKTDKGYIFFDIKVLYLKIGEERKLLEKARTIIDDLNLLVRNADAGWESFFQVETKDVCQYWQISTIE